MHRFLIALLLVCCVTASAASDHYLFVWAGDRELKGNDFLAVIDADPASTSYGRLLTTLVTDQQTVRVHHTEYTMPAGGMLFANDHDVGRTFILDVRDALQPKIAASFTEATGAISVDNAFRDQDGQPGFSFAERAWPHGWKGVGAPHGAVFSR